MYVWVYRVSGTTRPSKVNNSAAMATLVKPEGRDVNNSARA